MILMIKQTNSGKPFSCYDMKSKINFCLAKHCERIQKFKETGDLNYI